MTFGWCWGGLCGPKRESSFSRKTTILTRLFASRCIPMGGRNSRALPVLEKLTIESVLNDSNMIPKMSGIPRLGRVMTGCSGTKSHCREGRSAALKRDRASSIHTLMPHSATTAQKTETRPAPNGAGQLPLTRAAAAALLSTHRRTERPGQSIVASSSAKIAPAISNS